jgi:hypothetical protein
MIEFAASVRPPKIPSKYDIIPIHASDRGTFKKCRRKWDWSSPMRNNLQPKVEMQGIYFPTWFGSGVHYALAQYYNPVLKRDPVETFNWWWDLQMYGGEVVGDQQLDLVYDRKPQHTGAYLETEDNPIYKVRGLYELLPSYNDEEFEEHKDLGIGMLIFYKEYAEEHDNFVVICEEHTFSVPVTDDSGNVLRTIDIRDGREKEVHIRGTQDAIIQEQEYGKFGILEHKTAARIDEDYHRKLEKDEQCTTYMYAGEREAREFGLEYERIFFVLYNALRKTYPKPPTPTKNGLFSINRQMESTTSRMLHEYIARNSLEVVVESDEKLQAYVDYVERQGDRQFIERNYVHRNRAEIESCGERIFAEVSDMLDPNLRIYPNPTGEYSCLNCIFRAPCIARDDGSDWKVLLEDQFEENWTR